MASILESWSFRVLPVFTSESVLALLDRAWPSQAPPPASRPSVAAGPRVPGRPVPGFALVHQQGGADQTRVTTMSAAAPAWVQVR